jgi:phospholipid transport system substrate-binding protein
MLGLMLCGSPGLAGTTPAAARVETLHAALLGVLKDSATLPYAARFARLAPVVQQTFDLAFMAEKCIGRSWRTLDAEDRTRWIATFTRFTTANYAGRFTGFAGQSFETLGEEPGASDTTLVRTELVNPAEENVELTYRLRKVGDDWRIIDVYLDGTVSELALRRTEYSSVLKRDGFDTLVELVDEKIAKLAATEAGSATMGKPERTGGGA